MKDSPKLLLPLRDERENEVAFLSNTTYERLAKSDNVALIFMNLHNESFIVNELQTLKKTKTKIVSKWGIKGLSDNKLPFTHAALTIGGKHITTYEISPLDYLSTGAITVDYESED